VGATSREFGLRLFGAVLIGALFGAFFGMASAQDRSTGSLDATCATDCTQHGYVGEFCGRVCWIPDPAMAARGSAIDWQCFSDCRSRGGSEEDCRKQCRRR
jgi:hypothetical protein